MTDSEDKFAFPERQDLIIYHPDGRVTDGDGNDLTEERKKELDKLHQEQMVQEEKGPGKLPADVVKALEEGAPMGSKLGMAILDNRRIILGDFE